MQFNGQITHVFSTRLPLPLTETSYIHLCSHVSQKPILHGSAQRKYLHPYRKYQTDTTTTFPVYINIFNCKKNNYFEKATS